MWYSAYHIDSIQCARGLKMKIIIGLFGTSKERTLYYDFNCNIIYVSTVRKTEHAECIFQIWKASAKVSHIDYI